MEIIIEKSVRNSRTHIKMAIYFYLFALRMTSVDSGFLNVYKAACHGILTFNQMYKQFRLAVLILNKIKLHFLFRSFVIYCGLHLERDVSNQ